MAPTDLPDLMTTAQVAARLGVTVTTVNRWAADGTLPVARKLPGRTGANLYAPADVEALVTRKGSAA